MFVVSRLKSSDRSTDGDLCWIWYVGNASDAQAYSVRLDCGNRSKWRGNATSLESSITEVLKASRYAIVEVGCTHVFVEIKWTKPNSLLLIFSVQQKNIFTGTPKIYTYN